MKLLDSLKKKVMVACAVVMGTFASVAHATGPEAAFTALEAKVTEYEGYAWPLVIAITVAVASIGLFRRFATKAGAR